MRPFSVRSSHPLAHFETLLQSRKAMVRESTTNQMSETAKRMKLRVRPTKRQFSSSEWQLFANFNARLQSRTNPARVSTRHESKEWLGTPCTRSSSSTRARMVIQTFHSSTRLTRSWAVGSIGSVCVGLPERCFLDALSCSRRSAFAGVTKLLLKLVVRQVLPRKPLCLWIATSSASRRDLLTSWQSPIASESLQQLTAQIKATSLSLSLSGF